MAETEEGGAVQQQREEPSAPVSVPCGGDARVLVRACVLATRVEAKTQRRPVARQRSARITGPTASPTDSQWSLSPLPLSQERDGRGVSLRPLAGFPMLPLPPFHPHPPTRAIESGSRAAKRPYRANEEKTRIGSRMGRPISRDEPADCDHGAARRALPLRCCHEGRRQY